MLNGCPLLHGCVPDKTLFGSKRRITAHGTTESQADPIKLEFIQRQVGETYDMILMNWQGKLGDLVVISGSTPR